MILINIYIIMAALVAFHLIRWNVQWYLIIVFALLWPLTVAETIASYYVIGENDEENVSNTE